MKIRIIAGETYLGVIGKRMGRVFAIGNRRRGTGIMNNELTRMGSSTFLKIQAQGNDMRVKARERLDENLHFGQRKGIPTS
jgi:hypothetical protein